MNFFMSQNIPDWYLKSLLHLKLRVFRARAFSWTPLADASLPEGTYCTPKSPEEEWKSRVKRTERVQTAVVLLCVVNWSETRIPYVSLTSQFRPLCHYSMSLLCLLPLPASIFSKFQPWCAPVSVLVASS